MYIYIEVMIKAKRYGKANLLTRTIRHIRRHFEMRKSWVLLGFDCMDSLKKSYQKDGKEKILSFPLNFLVSLRRIKEGVLLTSFSPSLNFYLFILMLGLFLLNGCVFQNPSIVRDFKKHFESPEGWILSDDSFVIEKINRDWWFIFAKIINKECPYHWSIGVVKFNYKTKETIITEFTPLWKCDYEDYEKTFSDIPPNKSY